jgi:hypothetical protein
MTIYNKKKEPSNAVFSILASQSSRQGKNCVTSPNGTIGSNSKRSLLINLPSSSINDDDYIDRSPSMMKPPKLPQDNNRGRSLVSKGTGDFLKLSTSDFEGE